MIFFQSIGAASSICLGIEFILDRFKQKDLMVAQAGKCVVTGIALAAIRQVFGLNAMHGALVGVVTQRLFSPLDLSTPEKMDFDNKMRLIALGIGCLVGCWIDSKLKL